jgi:hypothetical protein
VCIQSSELTWHRSGAFYPASNFCSRWGVTVAEWQSAAKRGAGWITDEDAVGMVMTERELEKTEISFKIEAPKRIFPQTYTRYSEDKM